MADGTAPHRQPLRHFLTRTTTDKLTGVLDDAEASGAAVLVIQHIGGRDWVVVTRGPVIGPAGRRVFRPHSED